MDELDIKASGLESVSESLSSEAISSGADSDSSSVFPEHDTLPFLDDASDREGDV